MIFCLEDPGYRDSALPLADHKKLRMTLLPKHAVPSNQTLSSAKVSGSSARPRGSK